MVEVAKHLVVVNDLVRKVCLGYSSDDRNISGVGVVEDLIILANGISVPKSSGVCPVSVCPLHKPVRS